MWIFKPAMTQNVKKTLFFKTWKHSILNRLKWTTLAQASRKTITMEGVSDFFSFQRGLTVLEL